MKKYIISFLFAFSLVTNAIEVGTKIKGKELSVWKSKDSFDLSKSTNGKKLVVNFWASWCTACINELAELEELKKKYSDEYEFVAINAGEKNIKIKKFMKRYKFSYKILQDKNRDYSKSIGVEELPRTLVIDEKGTITYSGTRPPKKL